MHLITTVSVDPAGIIPIRRLGFEFDRVVLEFSNSILLKLVPGESESSPAIHSLKIHHQVACHNHNRMQSWSKPIRADTK